MKNGPALILLYSRAPKYFGPLILGLILYVVSLVVFAFAGELTYFFTEPLVPLIILDIVWVSESIDWGFRNHFKMYHNALELFDYTDRSAHFERFLRSLYNDRQILLVSLIPTVAFWVTGFLVLSGMLPISPAIYSHFFSSPILRGYLVGIAAVVGYLFGLGAFALTKHILFVKTLAMKPLDVGKLQLGHLIHHKSKRLQELNDLVTFSFVSSATVFLGSAIFIIALFPVAGLSNLLGVFLALSPVVVGVLVFALPQVYLHRSIANGKDKLAADTVERFEKKLVGPEQNLALADRIALLDMLEQIEKIREWPVQYELIAGEVVIGLFPIIAISLGRFLIG